jgi:membrane protease YdiL (CAAX protease family)
VLNSLAGAVASTLGFVRGRPLAAYLVAAFAFSWVDWLSLYVNGERVLFGRLPSDLAGMAGPAFAAFAVTAVAGGEAGLKDLALRVVRLPLRSPWLWLLAPSPIWVLLAVLGVLALLGEPVPSVTLLARYPGIPAIPILPVFDLVLLGVGFGQEIGWRGLALPRLQARHGPLGGALLLVLPWGAWMLPLLVVNGAWRGTESSAPVQLLVNVVLLLASSLVLAFLLARTGGSIPAVAFWHASLRMATATEGAQGVVGRAVSAVVVFGGVLIVVAELRARRRGRTLLEPLPARAGANEHREIPASSGG